MRDTVGKFTRDSLEADTSKRLRLVFSLASDLAK